MGRLSRLAAVDQTRSDRIRATNRGPEIRGERRPPPERGAQKAHLFGCGLHVSARMFVAAPTHVPVAARGDGLRAPRSGGAGAARRSATSPWRRRRASTRAWTTCWAQAPTIGELVWSSRGWVAPKNRPSCGCTTATTSTSAFGGRTLRRCARARDARLDPDDRIEILLDPFENRRTALLPDRAGRWARDRLGEWVRCWRGTPLARASSLLTTAGSPSWRSRSASRQRGFNLRASCGIATRSDGTTRASGVVLPRQRARDSAGPGSRRIGREVVPIGRRDDARPDVR